MSDSSSKQHIRLHRPRVCRTVKCKTFAVVFAVQFDQVAADMVLLQLGETHIKFSRVIFEINQLFKIRGHVLILDSESKYKRIYKTLYMSKHSSL